MNNFLVLDLPALLSLVLCSMSCALAGSFMILRKESLMSDAVSHSVLPGIIIAFYFSHDRGSPFIFLGAVIAAIIATNLITVLKEKFKIEQSSSTGVVFSIFFAFGIVLLEALSASNIDLDVDCVLHGQLETILWSLPTEVSPFSIESFKYVPSEIKQGTISLMVATLFYILYYKTFTISSFDRDFALSRGLPVKWIEFFYTSLVAIVAVSSFTVVGSILVIALMVCPSATARMYSDKLRSHVLLSVTIAIFTSLVGYFLAINIPPLIGYENALSISGTVVLLSGIVLCFAILTSPRYGIIARIIRTSIQRRKILEEDIIGYLYRYIESDNLHKGLSLDELKARFSNRPLCGSVVKTLVRKNHLSLENGTVGLTPIGNERGKEIVSKHRLWESFLVEEVGLREDHVHPNAEIFEHVIDSTHHEYLRHQHGNNVSDPHGKPIPK